jgi:ribonuclease HII
MAILRQEAQYRPEQSRRAILAGIDEAGYGPILGPLVVSSTAFSVPQELLSKNLWQILKKSVNIKKTKLAGRLLIADSKKAFTQSQGIGHIQRTTLACLKSLEKEPKTLIELLSELCPSYIGQLSSYPWYGKTGDYRLSFNSEDIAIASTVFNNDLSDNGLKFVKINSICLDVQQFNDTVAAVDNKSNVLFSVTAKLIQSLWDLLKKSDESELHIIIDRQGGKTHYRKGLQVMFESLELRILKETEKVSSYRLEGEGKKMTLHFVVAADRKYLPVSLASMVSKYLRELMVHNINNYFKSFNSQLKPTAGYWEDGQRFIKDLNTLIPHISYNSNQLIRCR